MAFGIPDPEGLCQVVEKDFERQEFFEDEGCFSLGDLWPGGLTVDINIGVIDWEFAALGRGANGDMAQLLAHLHLYLIAWKFSTGQKARVPAGIERLMETLCLGYYHYNSRKTSLDYGKEELDNVDHPGRGDSREIPVWQQVFRSALILHGREMINNAVETDWGVFYEDGSKEGEKRLVQRMIGTGVRCIQLAGASINGFIQKEHFEDVCRSREAAVISALFLKRDRLFTKDDGA
ncbi:conserved hypothetical protein [Coccidioides posadasii str. Silveira]|uniref:Aminoglycoside phosphotransferase domain-containing protein n=3 Tax=Coccidioides posadasii TaxID=199306 RepID=E9D9B9_COCPS|nr:conserved hypothetical protein [Coccidioides posadasii str. Silveira]